MPNSGEGFSACHLISASRFKNVGSFLKYILNFWEVVEKFHQFLYFPSSLGQTSDYNSWWIGGLMQLFLH